MTSNLFRAGCAALFAAVLLLPLAGPAQAADPTPAHLQELFFDAARDGRTDLLHGMIKDGMAVDARDARGFTALILAAYDGHLDTVTELLADGADACAVDGKGNTALMGVAFKGELEIARALAPRCDVNTVNREGQSAAMMAALFGHADIVQLLAARGARLDLKDASGNTALSLARQQGNADMAALLERLQRNGAG